MEGSINNNETILTITPITKKKSTMKITAATMVETDKLVPFQNRSSGFCQNRLFAEMVESVRACGVLVPIVVRPVGTDGEYEILSGHIRVEAAKEAGLKSIPAVVRRGMTEEEALFIVAETNRVQRSFADMAHSEKAVTLATQYEAIKKKPGFRSDLVQENENPTYTPTGHRSKTIDKLGIQYGLSRNTVARYLRVNKLILTLQARLDDGEIGMRVAEALSYLRVTEQEIIEELLVVGNKINTKQADALKKESAQGELNKAAVERIFGA